MASTLVLLTRQAMALDELPPCRRQNAQLWFSDLPAELQLAKAYCQPCPLRRACLSGAVERHEPHGVWGGEIFACGAIITDKRPPGRPPRTEGRAKLELPARRSSLADHAGLACAGEGLGPVGRAEIAQDVAGVLLHGDKGHRELARYDRKASIVSFQVTAGRRLEQARHRASAAPST